MNCAEKREMGKCLNCKTFIGGDLIAQKNYDLFDLPKPSQKDKSPQKKNKTAHKVSNQEFNKILGLEIMDFFRSKYIFHEKLIKSGNYFGIQHLVYYIFYLFYHAEYLLMGLIHQVSPIAGFDEYFSNNFSFGTLGIGESNERVHSAENIASSAADFRGVQLRTDVHSFGPPDQGNVLQQFLPDAQFLPELQVLSGQVHEQHFEEKHFPAKIEIFGE